MSKVLKDVLNTRDSLTSRLCRRCRRCSQAALREPSAEGVELIDEKIVAEGEREFSLTLCQRKLRRWR